MESLLEPIKIQAGAASAGGVGNDFPQIVPKGVAVADIETHAEGWACDAFPAFVTPVFGDLDEVGFDEPQVVREVLTEKPATVLVDDGHLVIAQPVDMVFLDEGFAVVDEELADVGRAVQRSLLRSTGASEKAGFLPQDDLPATLWCRFRPEQHQCVRSG